MMNNSKSYRPTRRNQTAKQRRRGVRPPRSEKIRGDAVYMGREVNMGMVQADRMRVLLSYPLMATLTNSGNSYVARRFTPNGLYDIDPTFGTTAMPGFAEYSNLYGFYVVVRYRYKICISNAEAFPVVVYVTNSTVDPTTSGTNMLSYSTQKYGSRCILSAKGGNDRHVFSGKIEVSALVGEDITKDSAYRTPVTSNPSDLVYLGLGLNGGSNDFTSAGCIFDLRIVCEGHFFDRKLLTS
jgi:hypothetical protein